MRKYLQKKGKVRDYSDYSFDYFVKKCHLYFLRLFCEEIPLKPNGSSRFLGKIFILIGKYPPHPLKFLIVTFKGSYLDFSHLTEL